MHMSDISFKIYLNSNEIVTGNQINSKSTLLALDMKINLRQIQMVLVICEIVFESPILAHFEDLALCLFEKHNYILGVCSILAKNITNFFTRLYKI